MIGNRLGHGLVLAIMAGVIAAHDALQLRELADHAGDEVGLGKLRRAVRDFGIGAGDQRRQIGRQLAHPANLVGQRAQLRMEGDVGQRRQAGGQRVLAVLVPEEFGIRQPGAQHALIAADDDRSAIRWLHVGDDDEMRGEIAALGLHREIFLVRPH